jgi:hypothetical protein
MHRDEYTPQQRAALVTLWLLQHSEVATTDVADRLGITWHGAQYILGGLASVLPIYKDNGKWRLLEMEQNANIEEETFHIEPTQFRRFILSVLSRCTDVVENEDGTYTYTLEAQFPEPVLKIPHEIEGN